MLPRQLLWIALVVPLLIGPIPSAIMGTTSWTSALRGTLAISIPFVSITGALIAFYGRVATTFLQRIHRRRFRIVFHVVAVASIAIVIGALIFPVYHQIDPAPLTFPSGWSCAS